MKNIVKLFMLSCLGLALVFSLAACGGEETTKPDNKEEDTTAAPPPTPPAELGEAANPEFVPEDTLDVTLDAGETYYVAVKNAIGFSAVIEDSNAVIHYKGQTYEAVDGKVSVPLLITSQHALEGATFGISAKNGEATAFTVNIVPLPGTWNDPYILESTDDIILPLEKNVTVYYQWTATKTGTFSAFYRVLDESNLTETQRKNNTSIVLTVGSRTTSPSSSSTLLVNKGETVQIALTTVSNVSMDDVVIGFEEEAIDPSQSFQYRVFVMTSDNVSLAGVSITLYTESPDSPIFRGETDANGSLLYEGTWVEGMLAEITLPDGYRLYDEDGETIQALTFSSGNLTSSAAVFILASNMEDGDNDAEFEVYE